jgi:hypothetical protein
MREPLFVQDPGEVLVFRDAEHLTSYLEAVDIETEPPLGAWDADGRRIRLEVTPPPYRIVVTREIENEPAAPEELRQALIHFFRRLEVQQPGLDMLPLPDLVQMSMRYVLP